MSKTIGVVGEPFLPYVGYQLDKRQKVYGSGINNKSRKPDEISYLNSRNAWLKFASAVNVLTQQESTGEFLDYPGIRGEDRLKRIFSNYKSTAQNISDFTGNQLAKNFVLFNGTSTLQEDGTYSSRAGVTNNTSLANDSAYGLGGTEFGIQPMPGISSFTVNHRNNGALRDGSIILTAYNRFQFDVIESLYLRLGFTMLVEWGNNIYYDTPEKGADPDTYSKMGSTLADNWWFENQDKGKSYLDIFQQIETTRKKYSGNYDAFVCVVNNFSWSIDTNGTYQINISLISLGSVIESLKVDLLHPRYTIDTTTLDGSVDVSEVNNSSIENYLLFSGRLQKSTEAFGNPLSPNQENTDYLTLKGENLRNVRYNNVDEKYAHFIRLGRFLNFLSDYILVHNKNNSKCFPIFSISATDESLCNIPADAISNDPRKCIIKPNENYFRATLEADEARTGFAEPLAPFFVKRNNETFGTISNIYLNFALIQNKIPKSTKNLDFNSFISGILSEINSCFGGEMNLYLDIDEERNQAIIRDENLKPGVKVDINRQSEVTLGKYNEEDYPVIEFLGYNREDETSNFITNFSFETTLSNNFLNQISIGATAAGQSVNEDATSYSQWSVGLKDGYKQSNTDGVPDGCPRFSPIPVENDKDPSLIDFLLNYNPPGPIPNPVAVTANAIGAVGKLLQTTYDFFADRYKKIEEEKIADYNSYTQYLTDAFAIGAPVARIEGDGPVLDTGKYFNFDDEFIARGRHLQSQKRDLASRDQQNKLNTASGLQGYLPAELSITFDGFSGVRIYNGIRLNSKLLPYNYPETLRFITIGVDHELSDNDWQTTIRAIAVINRPDEEVPPPSDFGALASTQEGNARTEEALDPDDTIDEVDPTRPVLYPPTDNTQISSIIRNDSGGLGTFGANRGNNRSHRGIDLETTLSTSTIDLMAEFPYVRGLINNLSIDSSRKRIEDQLRSVRVGTRIYAPITGVMVLSRATLASKLPGVKIIGNGQYAGYVAYLFYVFPNKALLNQFVPRGLEIGQALDVHVDYPSNVGQHVHFGLKRKGRYIDPSNFSEVEYVRS